MTPIVRHLFCVSINTEGGAWVGVNSLCYIFSIQRQVQGFGDGLWTSHYDMQRCVCYFFKPIFVQVLAKCYLYPILRGTLTLGLEGS